ncbi:hypothetical protein [Candidatus Berkiella aquae]|uniref:Uncharacterized protein n=1 Tax=Candidatus Berkiella aquae TaxID=295108 RepID=A0A0Q9YN43_9GAMM|nr:hypothetical protein [Candidatus Berkiella aquae]MCS5712590.1 hypothetical protein [Candidatus Berkiella aquae]
MPRKPYEKNLTPEQMLKKIRKLAQTDAVKGRDFIGKEMLKANKGYTDKQADMYILSFNEKAGTPQEQDIRKAQEAARAAVSHGRECPTEEYLKRRMKYKDAQVKAYLEKYNALAGTIEDQRLRKARKAGQGAASNGSPCLTEDALSNKGYTAKEIEFYLEGYQTSKGTEEEQALRKARVFGHIEANLGYDCLTEKFLQDKGYTTNQIKTYYEAYNASVSTKEGQALRKARFYGQTLARDGADCPTEEALKNKGYNDDEIMAYQKGYKAVVDNKVERSLEKEKALDAKRLQQFLDENGDVSAGFDIPELWGYKEILNSSTADKKALTASEEILNDNGLLFAFNSQTSTPSLTDSNFLALFPESEKNSNQETYSPF